MPSLTAPARLQPRAAERTSSTRSAATHSPFIEVFFPPVPSHGTLIRRWARTIVASAARPRKAASNEAAREVAPAPGEDQPRRAEVGRGDTGLGEGERALPAVRGARDGRRDHEEGEEPDAPVESRAEDAGQEARENEERAPPFTHTSSKCAFFFARAVTMPTAAKSAPVASASPTQALDDRAGPSDGVPGR